MRNLKRWNKLIPPWDMPSDPVKAVFWFMHWFLQVLVRFFWILILAGVAYESYLNGIVGGAVTLLVGLGVWLGLGAALFVFSISMNISRTLSEVNRMQQSFPPLLPFNPFPES